MNRFSGPRLLKARLDANMSRMTLSRAIDFDIGPQTIASYESGKMTPRADVLAKIASALNIPMGELFEEDGQDAES